MGAKDKSAALLLMGDPAAVYRDLQEFSENSHVLSAEQPRLIEQFPKQWVAVHKGSVIASASTRDKLLTQIDDLGVAPSDVIVRFIDRERRTMIL